MKRVFGKVEVVFDILYLTIAIMLGLVLVLSERENCPRRLAGIMAFILAGGDAFHLIPRIKVIITHEEERLRKALGRGKQITSITMTLFYVILYKIGILIFSPNNIDIWSYVFYALAVVRVVFCLLPQNEWQERYPPVIWGIVRNIPFFCQGIFVSVLYFTYRSTLSGLEMVWIAVLLSFMFYLPVVLWANRNPKIGMLMLPKTCAYLWLLFMCLSI